MRPSAFLVTGGSSGIGAAVASAITAAGHRVGIVSRRRAPPADLPALKARPDLVDWVTADLADAPTAERAIRGWVDVRGESVEGVVLSAASYGYGKRHPLLETTREEWTEVLGVNLTGQFVAVSATLPSLLARPRALILSISSVAAFEPAPGRAHYAASKAGSVALFRALREEMRDTAVSVVQVMPENQVATPGLRARRPRDYAFEGYDRPEILIPCTTAILECRGSHYDGAILVVRSDGRWHELSVQ